MVGPSSLLSTSLARAKPSLSSAVVAAYRHVTQVLPGERDGPVMDPWRERAQNEPGEQAFLPSHPPVASPS